MPGSYPDPRIYANTALQALEIAYDKSTDPQTSSLIYTAIDAIKKLKLEISGFNQSGCSSFDPHEWNESNTAI